MSIVKEFKDFAVKGNVIDLAVGVIIGGAFGKIVSSLVEDVMMPAISLLTGKIDFSSLFLILYRPEGVTKVFHTAKAAKAAGATVISYGLFLNNVVQFMIVAFAIFIVVKQINRLKRAEAKGPADTKQEVLLQEIRDILKKK